MLDLAPSKWQESIGIKGNGLELDLTGFLANDEFLLSLHFLFYSWDEYRIPIQLELLQIDWKKYT